MKATIIAAVAALSLGVSAASYAQGLPPNMWSDSSSQVGRASSHGVVFLGSGTVFSKIFGRSNGGQPAADRTAERSAAAARNG